MKQMKILKLASLTLFNQRLRHGHGQPSFKQSTKFWCGKLMLLYDSNPVRDKHPRHPTVNVDRQQASRAANDALLTCDQCAEPTKEHHGLSIG